MYFEKKTQDLYARDIRTLHFWCKTTSVEKSLLHPCYMKLNPPHAMSLQACQHLHTLKVASIIVYGYKSRIIATWVILEGNKCVCLWVRSQQTFLHTGTLRFDSENGTAVGTCGHLVYRIVRNQTYIYAQMAPVSRLTNSILYTPALL